MGTQGGELSGKKIAHCVSASVSIIEAPKLSRLLMRHGADVIPVMTREASKLVSPAIFEWSTGNSPITEITGKVEHVELVSSKRVDLVLIAPCTANTLAKIAEGISDDPVSTLVCTSLGAGIPLLIAPAMHEPMVRNPIIREAYEKLESVGVQFVEGRFVESKAKIAEPEEILSKVISMIGSPHRSIKPAEQDLHDFSFLITGGATREKIDQVRYITNSSSGKMGIALAQSALKRGANEVTLIHGLNVTIPQELSQNLKVKTKSIGSTQEMLDAILNTLSEGRISIFISAAAPSDYSPSKVLEGKISTRDSPTLNLELKANKKIITEVKEKFPNIFLVAFKAEYGPKREELIKQAKETLEASKADLIVSNDISRHDIGFDSDYNEVIIVSRKGEIKSLPKAPKQEIADGILDSVVELYTKVSAMR